MVRYKKVLLAAALAPLVLLSAGCSSKSDSGNGGGSASVSGSHLQKVLKSHTLRVGVQTEAAPWGVRNSNGKYEGFDIDIAKALGTALGAKVQFVPATNESRILNPPGVSGDCLKRSAPLVVGL